MVFGEVRGFSGVFRVSGEFLRGHKAFHEISETFYEASDTFMQISGAF